MPISHRERGLYWNSKRLDTPSPTPHPFEKNRDIKFFGVFDELVWEIFLIPWWSSEGGTFPEHVPQKHQKKFIPRFFSNGCGVGDGVSRRLEFQCNPLSR